MVGSTVPGASGCFLALPAVFLHINDSKMRASGVSTVKAGFSIEVLKADQSGPDIIGTSEDSPFDSRAGQHNGMGSYKLIPLDELHTATSPYLANDRLLLRVYLTVNGTVAAE